MKKHKQLKVRSAIRAGGIDPVNHNRRPLTVTKETRRLIAAADRLLASGEVEGRRLAKLIKRVRAEMG